MQSWNLLEVPTPEGTRDPVVLDSVDQARAVLVRLEPGQELGEHQVKERAWLCVVEGSVQVEADGQTVDAQQGMLFTFAPNERHAVAARDGGRILLFLAPWPGDGHYRGDHRAAE